MENSDFLKNVPLRFLRINIWCRQLSSHTNITKILHSAIFNVVKKCTFHKLSNDVNINFLSKVFIKCQHFYDFLKNVPLLRKGQFRDSRIEPLLTKPSRKFMTFWTMKPQYTLLSTWYCHKTYINHCQIF